MEQKHTCLHKLIIDGSSETFKKFVHKIKGTALNICASQLSSLALEIETSTIDSKSDMSFYKKKIKDSMKDLIRALNS